MENKLDKLLKKTNKGINDAIKTLDRFQKKDITLVKTSFPFLDDVCLGGLMPNLILAILGRPSHGKTYIASQLKEDILADKKRDIGLLYFNWEMPTFALLLTQIRKRLMIPLREILNLNPNKEQLAVMKEVADGFRDERLVTVEKSLSPTEFDYVCRKYIEENIEKEQLFIVVDHVGITKGSNKLEAIFEILEVMNNLKLDYPNKLTFIVLGQLNRDIERLWRTRDINPINLRVTSEYIYGSDALQQYADVIVASVIPEKAGLEKYCTVNRKRYEHLEEHIVDEDKASPKDYVRL